MPWTQFFANCTNFIIVENQTMECKFKMRLFKTEAIKVLLEYI